MPNFSQVQLIGHIGRDPETKTLQSGDTVTNFSLATNVKRNGEDLTTWWNCTLFGKRGLTLAQYLHKGDPVHVWGEPSLRPYTARDGTERTALEVRCEGFSFIGGKNAAESASAPRTAAATSTRQNPDTKPAAAPSEPPAAFDDDIPF